MKFNKKVLKNGLRIVTIPMRDNPTVTVMVLVEAGSKYETKEQNGISHFLEHMCFKGTERRPKAIDISRELDSIGAQYNAFTAQEFTGYYAKSDFKHLPKVLDVVSDMYLHPTLPPNEIEKEKGVIIEEINMYNDLPQKKVQDIFLGLLYGDQPAGWNIAGARETVLKMNRDAFLAYRRKFYLAAATLVVVAGQFDEKKILAQVERKFSDINPAKPGEKAAVVEVQERPKILAEDRKTDQTHFVLGVRTFDVFSKNNPALRVLSGVLGGGMSSRLFQKMREELGICYYISASADSFTDHGFLSISAGVRNERLLEAIKAVLDELKLLKTKAVSAAELQKVKDFLVGSMFLGLESSDSLADFYGFQEILRRPVKTPAEVAAEITAVTAAEVKKVAEAVFRIGRLNLALVGPKSDGSALQKILKL
jgi:predicted Zn-dependent peptidase